MRNARSIADLVGTRAKLNETTVSIGRDYADVVFPSRRTQRVSFEEDDRYIVVESIAVRGLEDTVSSARLDELILRTNHATEAVGLRRRKGSLTAFVKLLKSTLDRNEALHALVSVAREADRLAAVMTRRDDE